MKNSKLKNFFLFFLLSAFSFQLRANLVFAGVDEPTGEPGKLGSLQGLPSRFPSMTSLEKALNITLGFLTLVAGLMLIIYFTLGALGWISSQGKTDQLERARRQITNAVVGLIIVIGSYGLIYIFGQILGLDILDPMKVIGGLAP